MLLLYLVLMGSLALFTLRKPSYAFAGVATMFGVEQWTMTLSGFFVEHGSLGNILMGGLVVMGLVLRFTRQQPIFRNLPAVWWCVAALILMAVMSRLWTVFPLGWTEQWTASWRYIVTIVFLTAMLFHEPADLKHGLMGTLGLGAVVMLLLILTTDVLYRQIELKYIYHLNQKVNPLAIAQMASVIGLIAMLMNFRGIARFWQVARWFVVAMALMLVLRSGSRGEFFALVGTAVIFVPISRNFSNLRGILPTLIGFVIFGFLAMNLFELLAAGSRRWELESMEEALRGGRFETAKALLDEWASSSPFHWFMGLGNSASFDPNILGVYPHMVPLEILGEEGIIGFGIFVAICLLSARSVIRTYPLVRNQPDALGILAALGGILFFRFVLSCKTSSLVHSNYLLLFAILLGKYELAVLRAAKKTNTQVNPVPTLPPVALGTKLGTD